MQRALTVVLALCTALALTPPQAEAWPWSGTVVVQGKVSCHGFDYPLRLELTSANKGRSVTYSFGGTSYAARAYELRLEGVPGSGDKISWRLTCKMTGTWTGSFGVARPRVGTNTTRHICNFSPGCGMEKIAGLVLRRILR